VKTNIAPTSGPLSRRLCTLVLGAVATLTPSFCQAAYNQLDIRAASVAYTDGAHNTATITDSNVPSLETSYTGPHGNAYGQVTYRTMTLEAHDTSNSSGNGNFYASSGAWLDTLTINPTNPALLGTTGTARFTYAFSGSYSAVNIDGVLSSSWGLTFHGDYYDGSSYVYNENGGGTDISTLHTLTDDVTFTFGTPFQVQANMYCQAVTASSHNGVMDISMALQRMGFTILSAGNSLDPSAYSSSSTSGTDYQAAPEPSTWALLPGGLGALVFLQRLRRRGAHTPGA